MPIQFPHRRHAIATCLAVGIALSPLAGCFAERSFRIQPAEALSVSASDATSAPSVRAWLVEVHRQLAALLPRGGSPALLTDDLRTADGAPRDVYAHFAVAPNANETLLGNFSGLLHTAQAASRTFAIDTPAPPWPGFHTVWIPIDDRLSLCGRIGWAANAHGTIDADCIVILPGLFGDNGVNRSRDLALVLRGAGLHVLALELRASGQTEARYPHVPCAFGVLETDDLMLVSDWLQRQPHVRRTGLVGYCWGANIALLAAWFDSRRPDDPCIPPAVTPLYHTTPTGRRFAAGVVAFSPVLDWEALMERLEVERLSLANPVLSGVQDTIRARMRRKGHAPVSGSLRALIDCEYRASGVALPGGAPDAYPFLRILPDHPVNPECKLERARIPVLVVHAANDPLVPAQELSALFSRLSNPNVAGLLLPDGGHVGFAAYARRYYFSLLTSFFDPLHGAAASPPRAAQAGDGRFRIPSPSGPTSSSVVFSSIAR